MPTIERRKRERHQKAYNKMMDAAVANAPEHVTERIIAAKAYKVITSKAMTSPLSESLHTKGQHNAPWAKYDEYGNPLKREDPEGLGANLERYEDKETRAKDIRYRHRDAWGKRGVAKRIAYEEGFSVETIRRYMRDYPI
jgi:hypothetical protein